MIERPIAAVEIGSREIVAGVPDVAVQIAGNLDLVLQLGSVADLVLAVVVGIVLPLLAVALLWGIHDRVQEMATTLDRIDERLAAIEPDEGTWDPREE